jgi:hypothetical protein
MRQIFTFFIFIFLCCEASAQSSKLKSKPDPEKNMMEVEAGCGMCMFGLKDKDCLLSIRTGEKVFHVKGTNIDDHGDAHSENGFCNATQLAKVQGKAKGNSFVVTYFQLIPNTAKQKKK